MAALYGFIVQQNIQNHDKDKMFILLCRYRGTKKKVYKMFTCSAGINLEKQPKKRLNVDTEPVADTDLGLRGGGFFFLALAAFLPSAVLVFLPKIRGEHRQTRRALGAGVDRRHAVACPYVLVLVLFLPFMNTINYNIYQ